LVAVTDASGRVVDVSVAPASQVLMVSIDGRRRDLDRQIVDGLNAGRLSASDAAALRTELDRIAANESASGGSPGTLTYRQALVAAYDLNSLSARVYPTAVVTPVISPQFVIMDKQLTMVDQVTYRKLQLQRR